MKNNSKFNIQHLKLSYDLILDPLFLASWDYCVDDRHSFSDISQENISNLIDKFENQKSQFTTSNKELVEL